MGFFSKAFKAVTKPFKKIEEEIRRVDDQIMDLVGLGEVESPKLTDPGFDPFAVDNRSVIGASEALRQRLANKRGLSSTDVTGGIRSTATGLKPTLFTFN